MYKITIRVYIIMIKNKIKFIIESIYNHFGGGRREEEREL